MVPSGALAVWASYQRNGVRLRSSLLRGRRMVRLGFGHASDEVRTDGTFDVSAVGSSALLSWLTPRGDVRVARLRPDADA